MSERIGNTIGDVMDHKSPKKLKKWMGSTPKCDFCGLTGKDLLNFVDGKTIYGPWAMFCLADHMSKGIGIGLGKGQLYQRQEDGSYVKIEG